MRNPLPFSPRDLILAEQAAAPVQRLLLNFLKPFEGLLVEVVQVGACRNSKTGDGTLASKSAGLHSRLSSGEVCF